MSHQPSTTNQPSSSGEVLVRCANVGKKFCRDLKKSLWYGVKDSAADIFTRNSQLATSNSSPELRSGEFWANQDISFEVKRGECLGLIGRNGAGKTTLLKMLNGLIKPNCGHVEIKGQVSALIALGAGFNPVLTGRENIFVNGSILGLSRAQILDRLDAIVEFAELPNAIDSPVRTYSSGMQVRLGFASAVHLIEPDILLLDEVLAVGDIGFTIKCLNKMRELTSRSAVVFVTHSMQQISMFCTHAMLMRDGKKQIMSDDFSSVIEQYHSSFSLSEHESGTGLAKIHSVTITSPDDQACEPGQHVTIVHNSHACIEVNIETERPSILRINLHSQNLVPLIASDVTSMDGERVLLKPGRTKVRANLGLIDLNAGIYPLVIAIVDVDTQEIHVRQEAGASITVSKEGVDWGFISRKFELIPDSPTGATT